MKKEIVKRTLSNGIRVYLYADKDLKRVVASYNVGYGSYGYYDKFYYDDELYSMPPAMAHFLEHTLVETCKQGNMLIHFKNKSYEMNALTYPELTSFYFIGIKDTMESIKELIHMVDEPNFDEENIEKVKLAIVEETNKAADDKYRQGYNVNKLNAFEAFDGVHESYNTLGTEETTRGITLEEVKTCYDAYYNNENKFLVIGGNIDIDEMVEYLESIYAEIEDHPNKMREANYGDMLPIRKEYEEIYKPVANDYLIETFKVRNDFEEEPLLVDMYLSLFFRMKFAGETKFISDLTNDKICIGGMSHSFDFFKGVISITVTADVLNQEEFLKRVEGELNSEGLDEHLFELIKKSFKVNELSKMDYIYKSIMRFPLSLDFTEKLYSMDIVDKVTLADLRKFIDKIDWSLKTVTVIKKEEKREAN